MFVVNGNEKAVVAKDKLRTNFPFVKVIGERNFAAEIRSLHASKTRSTSTLHLSLVSRAGNSNDSISIQLPFIDTSIPAAVVFKLLGFQTHKETVNFIIGHSPANGDPAHKDVARLSLTHSLETTLIKETPATLIDYLDREGTKEPTYSRRTRYVEHILINEFLPHMGLSADTRCQARKASLLPIFILKFTRVATR